MYINEIRYNGRPIVLFATDDEVFTPHNPSYKKVQEILLCLGFDEKCNHNYGLIGFRHREQAVLQVTAYEGNLIQSYRDNLRDDIMQMIDDIAYVFLNNVPPENVSIVLPSYENNPNSKH